MNNADALQETCYGPVSPEFIDRAAKIRLLILDVDGVLSDGLIYMGNSGEELTLLPFKDGAFKIATKSGCAIVPISMNNTAEIFENHLPKVKKTHVVIEYGKPIYPEELDKDTKRHIGDYVENIIRETINKNAGLV